MIYSTRQRSLKRLADCIELLDLVDESAFSAFTSRKISMARWLLEHAARIARKESTRSGRPIANHTRM